MSDEVIIRVRGDQKLRLADFISALEFGAGALAEKGEAWQAVTLKRLIGLIAANRAVLDKPGETVISSLGERAADEVAVDEYHAKHLRRIGKDVVFSYVYPYRIPLADLDSPDHLIEWVAHLTTRQWITADIIGRFIRLVADLNEWDLTTWKRRNREHPDADG